MNRLNYLIGIGVCLLAALSVAEVAAQDIIAKGGTVTASHAGNDPNELIEKVVDGNTGTKYLTFNIPAPAIWIQWQCDNPETVGQYTLVSANDSPDRDPKDWLLEGSDDGATWTTLDTRAGELFASRLMTKTYFIPNTTAYTYYRLYVTAINGGTSILQLADWGLFEGAPPEAPAALNAIASGGTEVYLTWTDNSSVESGFELERSEDGVDYTTIAELDANAVEYLDQGGQVNTAYYYRARAVNTFGASAYSNVETITTLDMSGAFIDLTDDGGTLEVSNENSNTSESSPNLIDNDLGTKYLIPGGAFVPYSFQYQSATGAGRVVTRYTLVSGNDADSRDPKNWTFEGSDDGAAWTILDTRTGELFPNRYQARTFILNDQAQYTYYRVSVSANNGSTIPGQITEWQIWAIDPGAPAAPGGLTATTLSTVEIGLTWNDNAGDETGYELERRGNTGAFTLVKQLPANTTGYTDTGLTPATRYHYRVRATGAASPTVYSNVATDSTLYDPNLPLPPYNLVATTVSDTEIGLVWEDNSDNETGFRVQRSKDGVVYSVVATVGEDETGYDDTSVTLGTHYYYRILAFNDTGDALLYSNTAETTTTGANEAPVMDDIEDVITCNSNDVLIISVTGISPGVESYQEVTLSVSADDDDMFEQLTITQPDEGQALLSYKLEPGAADTVQVTVTAKDNGGSLNGGSDTYSISFTLIAYEIDVFISSDAGTLIERGTIMHLTASGDAEQYEWQDGPGILNGQFSETVTIRPTQGYEYTVIGSTSEGCTKEAAMELLIDGTFALAPQNILTPNNDGKNDVWVIWNIHTFPGSTVKVFDLSGREVYSKTGYTNDWDGTYGGKKLAEGVYYYVIDLGSGIQGTKGSLTILNE